MKTFFAAACLMVSAISAQNLNISFVSQLPYNTQTLANICGYAANNKEYALVGAENGMDIVDVTNPASPVSIVQIPNVANLWKEIKVYGNFAYVTTEGGGGLQIVDLTNLPSPSLNYHSYTGDGAINGQLNTIHALHIDTTKKFIYLYGTNLFNGGAVVLDINADPYNPTYAGKFEHPQYNYIHDGYVDNDTLYASHIYAGVFTVVDMTNKSNPVVLATQQTPTSFTHNTWLSDDRDYIFTTDENSASFLASYDISNLNNITEKDRFQTTPGSGSVVHNTHILNNWAVTSWYKDGVSIVDVTRPHNLVEVGRYDTYSGTGNGFEGAWGVYPYLPSGTLVVSNINEGLFVLAPTYVRACYLEGLVVDSVCNTPLNDVMITISSVNVTDSSDFTGSFATGTAIPGTYNVTFSKPGYASKTLSNVTFTPSVVNTFTVQLYSASTISLTGTVSDASNSNGLQNANVSLSGTSTYNFSSDVNGNFNSCSVISGTYSLTTGLWGYQTVCNTVTVNSGSSGLSIPLTKGYYDDFSMNLGWTVNSTASAGTWERGNPNGTSSSGTQANPGNDVSTDCGDEAYVTGNAGGLASQDDIDNGYTTLTSPVFDLSTYTNPYLHYDRWFYNGGGSGNPNDSLIISVTNGIQTVVVETVTANSTGNSTWKHSARQLSQYVSLTNNMRLIVTASDAAPGHLVEAGLDKFFIVDSLASSVEEQAHASAYLNAYPNPFSSQLNLNYAVKQNKTAQLVITDVSGREINKVTLNGSAGTISLNETISAGVYFISIVSEGETLKTIKVIRQ